MGVADGDGDVGVEGPVFPFGLVVYDCVQVVDEAGVVDRQEVFDLDGQEMQIVGQIRYMAQSAWIHPSNDLSI